VRLQSGPENRPLRTVAIRIVPGRGAACTIDAVDMDFDNQSISTVTGSTRGESRRARLTDRHHRSVYTHPSPKPRECSLFQAETTREVAPPDPDPDTHTPPHHQLLAHPRLSRRHPARSSRHTGAHRRRRLPTGYHSGGRSPPLSRRRRFRLGRGQRTAAPGGGRGRGAPRRVLLPAARTHRRIHVRRAPRRRRRCRHRRRGVQVGEAARLADVRGGLQRRRLERLVRVERRRLGPQRRAQRCAKGTHPPASNERARARRDTHTRGAGGPGRGAGGTRGAGSACARAAKDGTADGRADVSQDGRRSAGGGCAGARIEPRDYD
jgi:hypothetical protein